MPSAISSLQRLNAASVRRYLGCAALYTAWCIIVWGFTGGVEKPFYDWLNGWYAWDVFWYEPMIKLGYFRDEALVFAPLYSKIVGLLESITDVPPLLVALVFNHLCFFMGAMIVSEFFFLRWRISHWKVFALIITSPAAFYTFAMYTDALFFIVVWSLLYLTIVRSTPRWSVCAQTLLLFFAPLVRLNGYALLILILFKRWHALVIFLSLMVWFCLNHIISGNILTFINVQDSFGSRMGFVNGLTTTWKTCYHYLFVGREGSISHYYTHGIIPMIIVFLMIATAVFLVIHREWILAFILGAMLFVSHNIDPWRSSMRYVFPLMPMVYFMLLVMIEKASSILPMKGKNYFEVPLLAIIVVTQLCVQIYMAVQFRQWVWIA